MKLPTVKTASLSYQKDTKTSISISDTPLHAIVLEEIGGWFCSATRCFFCCRAPEWTWKLRWGKLDEDGYTDRCVGHYLYQFGSWLVMGFGTGKHARKWEIVNVPVTFEWVNEWFPDAGWPWDGSDSDDAADQPVKEDDQ